MKKISMYDPMVDAFREVSLDKAELYLKSLVSLIDEISKEKGKDKKDILNEILQEE